MTLQFMARRSHLPEVCGVCFRVAGNVGTVEPRALPAVQWICDACNIKTGMKVAFMNPLKLQAAEAEAFDAAIEKNMGDLIAAVMAVLWDQGVRDLSALTGDRFEPMVQKIFDNGEASKVIAKIFLAYAAEIRKKAAAMPHSDIPF